MSANEEPAATGAKTKAGAFDIRMLIGGLLGLYGVVLVITGLVQGTGSGSPPHADPDHLNVSVGIGLLVFSAVFVVWARIRPIVVPVEEGTVEAKRAAEH